MVIMNYSLRFIYYEYKLHNASHDLCIVTSALVTALFCTDPVNSKICHGLISRDAVYSILNEEGMEDGLYLVRKSRQRTNSYTLHVCLKNRIRNFEVKINEEGKLYILPNATFESLLKLVYYYHKERVSIGCCGWRLHNGCRCDKSLSSKLCFRIDCC